MSHELIVTSARRGLWSALGGYCAVAATEGIPESLRELLEPLSRYRHLYTPDDPNATLAPVNFQHLRLKHSGQSVHILSRIGDSGIDHEGRANSLAHHVALVPNELPDAGPAWLVQQPGFCETTWANEPSWLPHGRTPPSGDAPPALCRTWQKLAGDAGWAGVLAESASQATPKPLTLTYEPGQPVLQLLSEAVALLPPDKRWRVTFSTHAVDLPDEVACLWRCVPVDSPAARNAQRENRIIFPLGKPLGTPPERDLVRLARGELTATPDPVVRRPAPTPPRPQPVNVTITPPVPPPQVTVKSHAFPWIGLGVAAALAGVLAIESVRERRLVACFGAHDDVKSVAAEFAEKLNSQDATLGEVRRSAAALQRERDDLTQALAQARDEIGNMMGEVARARASAAPPKEPARPEPIVAAKPEFPPPPEVKPALPKPLPEAIVATPKPAPLPEVVVATPKPAPAGPDDIWRAPGSPAPGLPARPSEPVKTVAFPVETVAPRPALPVETAAPRQVIARSCPLAADAPAKPGRFRSDPIAEIAAAQGLELLGLPDQGSRRELDWKPEPGMAALTVTFRGAPLARLQIVQGRLECEWFASAGDQTRAAWDFFRQGVLKVTGPGPAQYLALQTPVTIPGLTFLSTGAKPSETFQAALRDYCRSADQYASLLGLNALEPTAEVKVDDATILLRRSINDPKTLTGTQPGSGWERAVNLTLASAGQLRMTVAPAGLAKAEPPAFRTCAVVNLNLFRTLPDGADTVLIPAVRIARP